MKIPAFATTIVAILVALAVLGGAAALVNTTIAEARANRHDQQERATMERIRRTRRIATARFRYRDVVYYAEETRVLGLIRAADQEVLFSVDVVVEAGLDLEDGFSLETSDGKEAFLTLPAPRVLTVDVDEQSIQQHLSRRNFSRIDLLNIADEVQAAKARNTADAIERGILLQAGPQASALMEGLLRSAGYERVHVRFAPAPELQG